MFKKTRYKFIAISMTGLLLVLALILGGVNIVMRYIVRQRINSSIDVVVETENEMFYKENTNSVFDAVPFVPQNGVFDEGNKDISMQSLNYITVFLDKTEEFYKTNMYLMSDDTVESLWSEIQKQGKIQGSYSSFAYRYVTADAGNLLVIVDISENQNILSSLAYISFTVIFFSSLIEFIFVLIMSKWAIKPLEESFTKQKRFISDASHELKTPLAVISANCDVLDDDTVNQKWIDNIKESTVRMNELVYSLLDLSRLDEKGYNLVMADFDLSSVLLNTSLEFECMAFENGKEITADIKENVVCHGNEQAIKQLFTILIDNAVKHSNDNGKIFVSLSLHGKQKIIKVHNTGSGIPDNERDKIFDRFYRSDESRSRDSGGYGLGLAIAKAIAESHKGTIKCDSVYGEWTCFTVTLN